ncbi:MAG: hypothetical protein CBD47_00250 [Synechococcus sp. TMED187]|nr:MAG: hypothetical protein CBD47_00250 [Synechococcus sp. TMED187]
MGGRPPRRRAPRSRACTSAGPRRGRRQRRCGRGATRTPPRSSGHRCVRGEARRCGPSAFRARPAARARRGARSTRRQTRGTRGRCRPPRLHSRARAPLACAARRGWPGLAPEPRARLAACGQSPCKRSAARQTPSRAWRRR